MQIRENISLQPYNTFGIDVYAAFFSGFKTTEELAELLTASKRQKRMVLGGGSNILFTGNFDGWVVKNDISGIEIVKEDDTYVYIQAGAGVAWHTFVEYCIENGWGGVENLSLIPGNVGASPMQNIGAYGAEIKDVFHELRAFHIEEKMNYTFSLKDCQFGYRESVFKRKYKDQFVILSVTYKLRKKPVFNTRYGAIEQELEKAGVKELTVKAVSDAVIRIRSSKLPDPKQIGNAGSFFKNPEVSSPVFDELLKQYPSIVGYKLDNGNIKLAAGWLIEQCGWRGYRRDDAGCHEKQALVLVNYGHANGSAILQLSEDIRSSVYDKYGVLLETEVNII